jgi:hypothetical protein
MYVKMKGAEMLSLTVIAKSIHKYKHRHDIIYVDINICIHIYILTHS